MKIKLIKYDHSRVQNTEKTNAICVFCKYFSKIDNSRKSLASTTLKINLREGPVGGLKKF